MRNLKKLEKFNYLSMDPDYKEMDFKIYFALHAVRPASSHGFS
jgi:hypothetical protein